jgi:hypothetical protein
MLKHVFLIVSASFSFSVVAQSPVALTSESGSPLNEQTIVITGPENIFFPNDEPLKKRVIMTNTSPNTIGMLVKRVLLTPSVGSDHQFCWGIQCYPAEVSLATDTIALIPSQSDNSFYSYFFPNGYGGLHQVRYVFFNVSNPNDSTWIDIHFDTPLSIDFEKGNKGISAPFPNPAKQSATFDFSIASGDEARIDLFNITGALVKSTPLNGTQGKVSIPLHQLANGVYFYTFYLNGKAVQTKRLVIAK